ncbi:MAG: hypothetical protein LBP57_05500 [Endomicrobium sp.]|jgi:hypothetical protein|nr:hypothetical protein [Endomicrobium sp.]
MLEISNYKVFNFENAIRGARNPLCSWEKSDSYFDENKEFILGANDLVLAQRLCKAGSDHRKFLRQVFVSVDILAPLYWWKEFDTYKIGTTANSTSTMHTIHKNKIEIENFSSDHLDKDGRMILLKVLKYIEEIRILFLETKNKDYWYKIIQLLPSSFNQLRTCTMSYENLINIYFSRCNHKLDEWKSVCTWAEKLPYFAKIVLNR